MGKYQILGFSLMKSSKNSIKYEFSEIEKVLGFDLPKSAFNHRAWWSNDLTHSQARDGWLNVGWEVKEVDQDQDQKWVIFQRISSPITKTKSLRKFQQRALKNTIKSEIIDENSHLLIKNSLLELNEMIQKPYSNNEDEIDTYFVSIIGGDLELEIIELEQFITKGIMLSGDMSGLIHSLMKVFIEIQPKDLIGEKQLDENEKEAIEVFEGIKKWLNSDVLKNFDTETKIFEEKDILRFFSHFIITSYSYVEIYVDRLFDVLLEDDFWFNTILKYLENENKTNYINVPLRQLRNNLQNPQVLVIEHIKKELPRNPYEKLKLLLKLIDTQDKIAKQITELNFDNYIRYFAEFTKIRNLIAHREPLPKIKTLSFPLIKQNLQEKKEQIDHDLIVNHEYPSAFKPLIDVFTKWLKDFLEIYEKVVSIKTMAIIFPAMIDRIIAECIND